MNVGGITYRQESILCGKPGCTCCPHGPYWYGYFRSRGKLVKKYVGKKLPTGVALPAATRPDPLPVKRMTPGQARKLLGIGRYDGFEIAQQLYFGIRDETFRKVPIDKEGVAAIDSAWKVLFEEEGW